MQRDDFQEMVEKCTKNISENIYPDKKLIIVHFVAGPKNFPYEIRRSEIRLQNSLFNDLCERDENNEKQKDLHNRALKNYIQYYARHNTYLTLVVRTFADSYEKNTNIKEMSFHYKLTDNIQNHIYDIRNKTEGGHTWLIDKKVLEELIPPKFAGKFWEFIYTIENDEDLYTPRAFAWMESLEFLRAITLSRFLQRTEGTDTPIKVLDDGLNNHLFDEHSKYKKEYSCITAFQSMSIFMRGLKYEDENMMGTTAIVKSIDTEKDEYLALVVVMVSPTDDSKESKIQSVYNQIDESFQGYRDYTKKIQIDGVANIVDDIIKEIDNNYDSEEYLKTITSVFRSPIQKYNVITYCKWILLLINKLINKVHENRKLEFYFVCGDRSEFEDNGNIDYQPLRLDDVNILSIPFSCQEYQINKDMIKNAINIATTWLSKEHFPWFEEGKYALLWDVSSNERRPCGLVKIKNSSWERFLKDRFIEYSTISIPKCLIGCITGDPQTSSIIVVEEIKKEIDTQILDSVKIEERYRWENKRLINLAKNIRIEGLDISLFNHLASAYGLGKKHMLFEEIKKNIKWMADDPNRGSILVFLNKDAENHFKKIGMPWNISVSKKEYSEKTALEDRIALMSHDGATVISFSDNKFIYSYRHLLTSDGIKVAVKDQLELLSLDRELEDEGRRIRMDGVFPLSCVGTRRWSAALTAFKKEVLGVVVISQDGDIHYWRACLNNRKNGNGGLQDFTTEIYFFSSKEECLKYSYEEGSFIKYSYKEGIFVKS